MWVSGLTAAPAGIALDGKLRVLVTASVAPSMTVTAAGDSLTAYTASVTGSTATSIKPVGTGMVETIS